MCIRDSPESISDNPMSVFPSWPWAAGNVRYFLSNLFFRKSRPPIGPLEFRPRAKSYFRWSSTYQLFQKKFGLETVFFLIFRFQDNKKCWASENNKKLFFILSLLGFILQRLCSRQVPHVASHPGSLYPGISDLSIWVKDMSRTCDPWKLLAASGRVKDAQVPRIPSTWRIW